MDTGRYIDFNEEKPNVVWGFVDDGDGFVFKQYHLSHAALGDSDSVYCKLPDDVIKGMSKEEIVETADSIADYINDSYEDFLKHAFNCPDDRAKDGMKSNREIYADAVLVLAKKRYIARVINDEGDWVDKLKIMGVELKRSSASDFLKEVLMTVVKAILDGEDERTVKRIMRRYKEEIVDRDITEIAVPSSCKTLKKATDAYEKTGSMKGLHITAKSALLFNLKRNSEDPEIYPGDKVYTVYTRTPEGSIAFPLDSPPPQWLLDIPIDYDRMWEKVDKAVSNYIVAMQWDAKSKREKKRMELFGF